MRYEKRNAVLLQNKTGWTALHEAACNGRKEVARLLLDYGADPAICTPEGDTVLHKAARWNRTEIIQLLLAVGVDVNATDNVSTFTFKTHMCRKNEGSWHTIPQTIQEDVLCFRCKLHG